MHISISTPTTPREVTCPIVEIMKIIPEIISANEIRRTILMKALSCSEIGSKVRNEDSSDTSESGMVDKGIPIETPRTSKLQ